MIKCLNTLFCKECRVEADGLITIASIYSIISRKDMPANIPLAFVSFLELSLNDYNASSIKEFDSRVIIFAPWGTTIGDSRQTIPFQQVSEKIARSALVVQYGSVMFMEFGEYSFEVYVNDEHLCTSTLTIQQDALK